MSSAWGNSWGRVWGNSWGQNSGQTPSQALALEIAEVNRLAGSVTLYWNLPLGSNSPTFTLQNNEQTLQSNVTSPYQVTGLVVGTSYLFKVVTNTGLQSNEIAFEFGANEVLTVTPMNRQQPWPSTVLQ